MLHSKCAAPKRWAGAGGGGRWAAGCFDTRRRPAARMLGEQAREEALVQGTEQRRLQRKAASLTQHTARVQRNGQLLRDARTTKENWAATADAAEASPQGAGDGARHKYVRERCCVAARRAPNGSWSASTSPRRRRRALPQRTQQHAPRVPYVPLMNRVRARGPAGDTTFVRSADWLAVPHPPS